jgi:hypothetical protein
VRPDAMAVQLHLVDPQPRRVKDGLYDHPTRSFRAGDLISCNIIQDTMVST